MNEVFPAPMVRPNSVQLERLAVQRSMRYCVIGLPFEAGWLHDKVTVSLPFTTPMFIGALGVVYGVATMFAYGPYPTAVTAATRN